MHLGICPVRISFAGGGTDMPEYYETFGGNVVTTAISRFTYVIINFRNDKAIQVFSPDFNKYGKPTKFEKLKIQKGTELIISSIKYLHFNRGVNVMISSDVPPRSGLGSSSSLTVNLVNMMSALKGNKLNKDELAEKAFHIGRNYLNWPIGKQDEYIAAYGGFNFIEFNKKGTKVTKIPINRTKLETLERNLILFFVGGRTNSKVLSSQIKRTKNLDKDTISSLDEVKQLGIDMFRQLRKSNIESFGELLDRGWNAKRKFTIGVTNDRINRLYELALKNGAEGGKLTGAGGGGHLLFYCQEKKQPQVVEQLKKAGLKQINFSFHNDGAKIFNLYDYT